MLNADIQGSLARLSSGAGRTVDLIWPAKLGLRPANGTNIGALGCMGRPAGVSPIDNTSSQNFSGVASSAKWGTGTGYRGRAAAVFNPGTGAAGTGVFQTLDAMVLTPTFGDKASQSVLPGSDYLACYRLMATMAFEPHQSYAGDAGIICACANVGNYDLTIGGCTGFGIISTAQDEVSFVSRQTLASPLVKRVIRKTSAADLQTWHDYEIRVIGTTKTQNAQVKVLIDGALVLTLDWVNDLTLLTPIHQGSNVYGFQVVLVDHCASAVPGQTVFDRVQFSIAPTEEMLI